jgi:hypothetical protein
MVAARWIAHRRAKASERGCGEPERCLASKRLPLPLAAEAAGAAAPSAAPVKTGFFTGALPCGLPGASVGSGWPGWRVAWLAADGWARSAKVGPCLASFCNRGAVGLAWRRHGVGGMPAKTGPSPRQLQEAPFARLAAGTNGPLLAAVMVCGCSERHSCVDSSMSSRKASLSGPSCTSVGVNSGRAAIWKSPLLPASARPFCQPLPCLTPRMTARSV